MQNVLTENNNKHWVVWFCDNWYYLMDLKELDVSSWFNYQKFYTDNFKSVSFSQMIFNFNNTALENICVLQIYLTTIIFS